MLIVIRKSQPDRVFADHRNRQIEEVLESYPAEEFEIWRTDEQAYAPGPLPETYVVVERPEALDG